MASIFSKKYTNFRGVDRVNDPANVDETRSPDAVNVIRDGSGAIAKRCGFRTAYHAAGFNANCHSVIQHDNTILFGIGGLFFTPDPEAEDPKRLKKIEGVSCITDSISDVTLAGYTWLFTGNGLIRWDGTTTAAGFAYAADIAKIPIVIIGRSPAGGGESYEAINLLTDKKEVRFAGDGDSAEYLLPWASVSAVEKVVVNGRTVPDTDYELSNDHAIVIFAAGHIPPPPSVEGEDNVYITVSEGTASSVIDRCKIATLWGVGGAADRVVCTTGNNIDYISAYNDPTYFPADQYMVVGSESAGIVGYFRYGEYLAVCKRRSGEDTTVYLHSGSTDAAGKAIFRTVSAVSGVSPENDRCFGTIGSDRLVLTDGGIFSPVTISTNNEVVFEKRSMKLGDELFRNAKRVARFAVSYKNRFLAFVGENIFVLDGEQTTKYSQSATPTRYYEAFAWNGVFREMPWPQRNIFPCCAKVVTVERDPRFHTSGTKDILYVGMNGGEVLQYMDDEEDFPASQVHEAYADEMRGTLYPIKARWSTPMDDDGNPTIMKTILKKGNAITLKPELNTGVSVSVRVDGKEEETEIWRKTFARLSFRDFSFSFVNFGVTGDGVITEDLMLHRKVKNYKRIQFVIKNETIRQGMKIIAITKSYVKGNFAKR